MDNKSTLWILGLIVVVVVIVLLAVFLPSKEIEEETPENIVVAKLGEEFTITLDSGQTTGYQWEATFDEAYLSLVDSVFVPNEELEGAGGTEEFTFSGIQIGDSEIRFSYVTEGEESPAEEIVYSVSIVE